MDTIQEGIIFHCSAEIAWKCFDKKLSTEAVTQRCFVKNGILKDFAKLQVNTCVEVSFLIKLQASGLQFYQRKNSGTGVLLWILGIF